jgi:hypothetical protein
MIGVTKEPVIDLTWGDGFERAGKGLIDVVASA